jgi:hypothetical protein
MATDGVTALDVAHVPDKSAADTISGQWAFTKPVATAGGTNFTKNGDFETWNLGATVTIVDWTLVGAGASYARDAATQRLRTFAIQVTRAGTDCYLSQFPDAIFGPVANWQSKTVVLGAWVKATVASRARIGINDGASTTFSSYHTGGGTYEFLTVSVTLGGGITALEIRLQVDTGNTTATFDGVTFTLGSSLSDPFPSSIPATVATVPKVLTMITTAVGNVGAGTDDLMTYTMFANQLAVDAQLLRITTWGTTAANANTKAITLNFGATVVSINPTTTAPNNLNWRAELIVVRTGAATQIASGVAWVGTVLQAVQAASPAETLSGSVVIKGTGTATADNDIVQRGLLIEFLGA